MQHEIESLKTLLAEANKRLSDLECQISQKLAWPCVGDTYYFVDGDGDVAETKWDSDLYDNARRSVGNIYPTAADGDKAIERMRVRHQLQQLANESWEGVEYTWAGRKQAKYVLYFDHDGRKWEVSGYSRTQHVGQVHFRTEGAAEQAIQTIGEERLKTLLVDAVTTTNDEG